MAVPERRHRRWLYAAAVGACACVAPALTSSAGADSATQLHSKLGATQSQLNRTDSRAKTLSESIAALNGQVSALAGQISIVQARQAAARERLETETARVHTVEAAVARERERTTQLHHVLARAQRALAAELRSQYEQPQQSLVSLVIDSGGFQELLDGLQYLSRAKQQERSVIVFTRRAKAQALAASARLLKLERTDSRAASTASTQNDALAGMSALLDSREAALTDDRAAQTTALAASREQGSKLEAAISGIQEQEAAALAATRTIANYDSTDSTDSTSTTTTTNGPIISSSGGSGDSTGGAGLGGTDGWAIPYAVVLCESGGQNLPPNSASASGYYQIEAATWKDFGGSGPAAYLAPKSEQDAVASRIWNNGKGASNWTCARIVGIT